MGGMGSGRHWRMAANDVIEECIIMCVSKNLISHITDRISTKLDSST